MAVKKATKGKKATTTAVAQLDQVAFTKEGVPDMLEIVQKQITELQGNMPKSEKTVGAPDGFPFAVKDCKTVDDLIKMHSFVIAKQKAYEASAAELGLTPGNYPFKLGKYAASTWVTDIKFRLAVVKNKTKLDKLNKVKTLLENNLSEEMKFKKQMQEMADILTDPRVD